MKRRTVTGLPIVFLIYSFLALTACDSDSSSSRRGTSTPSTPGIATYTINATGGIGGADGGNGGDGGYFYMYKDAGIGEIAIRKSGQVDASFTMPTRTAFTGDNVLTISANTTIAVYNPATDTPPAANTPYVLVYPYNLGAGNVYDDSIYISDGDGVFGYADADEDQVTGVIIKNGATLTLGLNANGRNAAQVDIENDIVNNGVLTASDVDAAVNPTTPRGRIFIYADSYHGNGLISLYGTAAGQDGGDLELSLDGNFTNTGAINTSGADATDADAGDGGGVYIYADGGFANTGTITSHGGNAGGTSGNGGYAGGIDLENYYGNWLNSGSIDATGGTGIDGGGNGSYAFFYIGDIGNLHNTGNINTSGGDTQNGNGGNADYIEFYIYGLDVLNSGNLTATGGDTADATGSGGNGDYVYFYNDSPSEYAYNDYINAGDMLISGNIDTSGGNAVATGSGSGGDGDYVYFEIYNEELSGDTSRLVLSGYTAINTSGADGNYPGAADYIYIQSYYDNTMYPPGPVVNEAAMTARGGDVVAGATNASAGGHGDYVEITTGYSDSFAPHLVPVSVTNSGNINTSGGESYNATSDSAYAGDVFMYAWEGLTNTGNITAAGGDDRATDGGTNGYGGDGGEIELYADSFTLKNSGNLKSSGGDGEYVGGDADPIYIYGMDVANTGNLIADGGNATAALAGSYGGDGDDVEVRYMGTSTGTVSCAGGTGETPGDDEEGSVFYQRVF